MGGNDWGGAAHGCLSLILPGRALNPDEFVKVQVANMNIPTDSVFQIISERGFVRGTEAKTEFVGSVVEYGP